MSLTDNTTELEEVLTLANSIEVPNIQSISVNGVAQTPDENKNVNLTIPESSGASLYQHEIEIYFTDPGANVWGVALVNVYSNNSTKVNSPYKLLTLLNATDAIYDLPATGVYLPNGTGGVSTPETIVKIDYIAGGGSMGYGTFRVYTTEKFPQSATYPFPWYDWAPYTFEYGYDITDTLRQIL